MNVSQLIAALTKIETSNETAPDLRRLLSEQRQNIQAAYAKHVALGKCIVKPEANLGETMEQAKARRSADLAAIMARIDGYRSEANAIADGYGIRIG